MPLTDADWGEIQSLIGRMVGKAGSEPFIQSRVSQVDELKRLIYIKELADVPIPMVEFEHEVKTYVPIDPGTPVGSFYMWPTAVAPTNHLFTDGQSLLVVDYPELHGVIGYDHGGSGANFTMPNWKGRTPIHRDSGQTEFDVLHETGGAKTHALSAAEGPVKNHTHLDGTLAVASHSHGGGVHNHGVTDPGHWHEARYADISNSTFAPGTGVGTRAAGGAASDIVLSAFTSIGVNNSATIISAEAPDVTGATGNPSGGEASGSAHNNLQPYKVTNFVMRAKASSGYEEPTVVIQKQLTTPQLPSIGQMVLIAMLMGDRRMPRCLGVISAPASYLVHPGEI